MNIQEIIAYLLVAGAFAFLVKKFFWKKKRQEIAAMTIADATKAV
ncbi:FeoB-associated Cys-rich membrane protein [Flavobacterium lindanitolerans]|nr:FeoB-associated Cys-rich membrane protein [Flavobacterium lindanitolerans]